MSSRIFMGSCLKIFYIEPYDLKPPGYKTTNKKGPKCNNDLIVFNFYLMSPPHWDGSKVYPFQVTHFHVN